MKTDFLNFPAVVFFDQRGIEVVDLLVAESGFGPSGELAAKAALRLVRRHQLDPDVRNRNLRLFGQRTVLHCASGQIFMTEAAVDIFADGDVGRIGEAVGDHLDLDQSGRGAFAGGFVQCVGQLLDGPADARLIAVGHPEPIPRGQYRQQKKDDGKKQLRPHGLTAPLRFRR
ncbi:hypothetical protein SDC9_134641 [bioreactor metagenome]|uniref:Uncharacterized protein n=1 Tax=bioreactor metagenome TaxID=1076179 RepID=A0A645DG40_9ZZZZ